MRKVLAILLIIPLAGGILFAGGILYYNMRSVARPQSDADNQWTSERIAKEPDKFMKFADQELSQAVQSLEGKKNDLAQRKEHAQQQIDQLHVTRELAITQFAKVREAYRQAATRGSWPVEVSGSVYSKDALEGEIVVRDGEITSLEEAAKQLAASVRAVYRDLPEIEERIRSARATKLDVSELLENFRAEPTPQKLTEIWLKIQDARGQSMVDLLSPTDELIHQAQESNTERDRLRDAMERKIEEPKAPMTPSTNEPIATTASARPPSQELVPTPSATPAVRPVSEKTPPTAALPAPPQPPLAPAPPAPGITAPADLPLKESAPTARLEIFTLAADSSGRWSPQPVIKTYWKGDLRCLDAFLLPDLVSQVGLGYRYWAKLSFHFEAKQPGTYEFTVQHNRMNDCFLRYLGQDVVKSEGQGPRLPGRPSGVTGKGLRRLETGFYRFEFWLLSKAERPGRSRGSAAFEVKVLTPDASDAVPITADMIRP